MLPVCLAIVCLCVCVCVWNTPQGGVAVLVQDGFTAQPVKPPKKRESLGFQVSESSSLGHQTRQSMSDANRRLSAVQGERKRHILNPFTTVSSPRQPRRALSRGTDTSVT